MWDERADWKAWWVENVALFPKALAYAAATIGIAIFASATPQSFIYFQF